LSTPRDPRILLWDMNNGALAIAQFVDGISDSEFEENDLIRAAVERKFSIIGEALDALFKSNPDLAARISNFRQIINFRHLLNHHYSKVESYTIWTTVKDDLPKLIENLSNLLTELG